MKKLIPIPVIALCVLLAGCGGEADSSQTGAKLDGESGSAKNQTEAGKIQDAAGTLAKQVDEDRQAAISAMADTLTNWDSKIRELSKRTETLADSAKAESGKAIASLRHELDDAGASLYDLRSVSEDRWREAKAKFDEAIKRLKETYENAAAKFD